MRHQALMAELERAESEHAVRVAVLRAPRGMGRSHTVAAFAEEQRGRGVAATLIDCELAGAWPGGCLDALLRARLGLGPVARGAEVTSALDTRSPDLEPLAREFLCFVLGESRADFATARLDPKSRWEGAVSEVARWLPAQGSPWVLVLDDAPAADAETLQLVELLGIGGTSPGLVVLTTREEQQGALEPRLKALRTAERCTDVLLPLPSDESLVASFGDAVTAARHVPLTAQLLSKLGSDARASTLDAAVRDVVQALPAAERAVLELLCVAGGRLPGDAIEATLGGRLEDVFTGLEARCLVRRAVTRRFPGTCELVVRFPSLMAERGIVTSPSRPGFASSESRPRGTPSPWPAWTASSPSKPGYAGSSDSGLRSEAKQWLATLGVWAEQSMRGEGWAEQQQLVLPLVIRASEASGDSVRASLAWELWGRSAGGVAALRRAEATATGVRRLVLARKIAEEEVFAGEAQKALATLSTAMRGGVGNGIAVPPAWREIFFRDVGDELERWDRLSPDEAFAALELARAETLSQLGNAPDAKSAFAAVEAKLLKLRPAPTSAALWLRMARTWVWFIAEILADGPAAQRFCALVHRQLSPELIAESFHAPAFIRAEQVAASRGGDSARARSLADELIALSKQRGDVREECVAWNARSLMHLRDGELSAARRGFERSLELARRIGFRRREAVALHNLGLVTCQLGEYGAALACQSRYLALSEQIGNGVARAYGPAAIGEIHAHRGEAAEAEPLLLKARRAAEENGWPGLVAWTRHLGGLMRLLKHFERKDSLLVSLARADFMACLDILEDRKAGWSEELDPAEVAACLALTWLASANKAQAAATLKHAEKHEAGSAPSKWHLTAAKDLVEGRSPEGALAWFDEHGQARSRQLWLRATEAFGVKRAEPSGGESRAF